MVASPHHGPLFTRDEYEEFEQRAGERHEYHGGYVYAMSGGTLNHSQISGNVYALLRAAVRGSNCRAFTDAVRVRATASDDVYPDISVTCDPRDLADLRRRVMAYPSLVVEVLSPSTALYDQNGKFDLYRQILDPARVCARRIASPPAGSRCATRMIRARGRPPYTAARRT